MKNIFFLILFSFWHIMKRTDQTNFISTFGFTFLIKVGWEKKLLFVVLIMLSSEPRFMCWMFGYFFWISTENFFEVPSKLKWNKRRGKNSWKNIKGFKTVQKTKGGELSHFDGEIKAQKCSNCMARWCIWFVSFTLFTNREAISMQHLWMYTFLDWTELKPHGLTATGTTDKKWIYNIFSFSCSSILVLFCYHDQSYFPQNNFLFFIAYLFSFG